MNPVDAFGYFVIGVLGVAVACLMNCCAGYPTPKGGCIDTRDGGSVTVLFQRGDASE